MVSAAANTGTLQLTILRNKNRPCKIVAFESMTKQVIACYKMLLLKLIAPNK